MKLVHMCTSMFSGCAELSSPAVAAARALAALSSSSPEGMVGLREASSLTALASSVRFVELWEKGPKERFNVKFFYVHVTFSLHVKYMFSHAAHMYTTCMSHATHMVVTADPTAV